MTKEKLLKRAALLGENIVEEGDSLKNKKRKMMRRRRNGRVRYRRNKAKVKVVKSKEEELQEKIRALYQRRIGLKKSVSAQLGGNKARKTEEDLIKMKLIKEINRKNHQIKFCYEAFLKRTIISGRMEVEIRINPAGIVTSAEVITPKFKGLPISRCIVRKIKKWQFTGFTGVDEIVLRLPYELSPLY